MKLLKILLFLFLGIPCIELIAQLQEKEEAYAVRPYVLSTISSTTLLQTSDNNDFEILIVKIEYKNFKSILVLLYSPCGSSLNTAATHAALNQIITAIDDVLSRFSLHSLIIVGDFNRLKTDLLEINYCLANVVKEPTRMERCLDLIFLPEDYLSYYNVPNLLPPIATSDHCCILLKPKQELLFDDTLIEVLDFRQSNLNVALHHLLDICWNSVFENKSLDEACNAFYDELRTALDLLPRNYVRRSSNEPPWMTNTIIVLINKRYDAYKRKNWPVFRHYRDKVKKAILDAKRIWGRQLVNEGRSIWDIRKSIKGEQKCNENWLPNCKPSSSIENILEEVRENIVSNFTDSTCQDQRAHFFQAPVQILESEVKKHLKHISRQPQEKLWLGSDPLPDMVKTS